MNKIEHKIGNAAKWSVFTEIVVKVISPITSMILARLLTPEEFGVVATVTMIVSFSDIFTDAGFQKYIIQHKFKNKKDEDVSICVAFWTNLVISIFLWGIIFIFSSTIATAVGNPGLEKVIYIGALILPITSFSSIQSAIFRKNLNYKTMSLARIIIKIIPLLIAGPLAILGFSYWSLIIGNIISELSNAIILSVFSHWKPRFTYSLAKLKEMFSFCIWSFCESISSWLVTNIGIFLIGRYFSQYYLGIYKTSTTMVTQVVSIVSAPTISVLLSGLSAVQNNYLQYHKIYMKFLYGIGILTIPIGFGILVYRDVLRTILLGSQWGDADLIIGLWGFVLAESVIFNGMSGTVILSLGKPKLLFISNVTQAIIMIPSLYFSSLLSFNAMVIVSCVVRLELPILQTYMACKLSNIKILDIFNHIKYFIFASFGMTIFALVFRTLIQNTLLIYFSILLSAIMYFIILWLITPNKKEIKNTFKQLLIKSRIFK